MAKGGNGKGKGKGQVVETGTDDDDVLLAQNDTTKINGGDGNDNITGGDNADRVNAGDGDDTIFGGLGNDTIFGNDGFDTAVFSGSVLDYTWADGKGNSTIVSGNDGVDTLKHVEALQFDDFTLFIDGRNNFVFSQSDEAETDEDSSVNIDVLANDIDFDGDDITVTAASSATAGVTVTINTDNTLTYDPGAVFQSLALGETTTDTVTYTVDDGNGGAVEETVTVTITGRNDGPTLTGASMAAVEDGGPVDLDLTPLGDDIDSDDDGGTLNYSVVTNADEGSASISGTTLTFDPGAAFQDLASGATRTVEVEIQATDSHGATSTIETVEIEVTGVNDRPVVSGPVVAGSVTEDDAPVAIDLLANSSDPDNDDLDVEDVSVRSSNGARNIVASVDAETGELVIDPAQFNDLAAGASETVTVSYNVSDTTADFSDSIGSPSVPNGGVTYVVDFDTGNTFTFVRSGGPFLPDSLQPENGAYLHLNPNNGFSGGVFAATYRDGVETPRDASEFDFGDYSGTVSGAAFSGAFSNDTLTWTAHDVATADGERCVSIRLDDLTHFRTDGITVGSASFDVTADVAAEATIEILGVNDAPEIDADASDLSSDLTVGFTRADSLDADDLLANFIDPSRSAVVVDEGGLDVLHVGTGGTSRTSLIEIPVIDLGEIGANTRVGVTLDGVIQRTSGDQDLFFGVRDSDEHMSFFTTDGVIGGLFSDTISGGVFGVAFPENAPINDRVTLGFGSSLEDFTVRMDLQGESDQITLVEGDGTVFNISGDPGLFLNNDDALSVVIAGDGFNESYEIVSLAYSFVVEGLIDSGTIAFTDVDVGDTHSAAVTGVATNGDTNGIALATLAGFLTLGAVTSSSGGSTGSVDWSFEADDALFDYLGAGESLEIAYTVEVDDNNGGTASETVAITINGLNDTPVNEAGVVTGAVSEDNVLAASGDVNASDADSSDVLSFNLAGDADNDGTVDGAFGSISMDEATGEWTYTLDNASAAVQDLNTGDVETELFEVEITDGSGGLATQTISVTVSGEDDSSIVEGLVGFYDMQLGRGDAYMANEIALSGHDAQNVFNLSAAELENLDVLNVYNPNNGGFGGEYLANRGNIFDAVENGMTLIVHDRQVGNAETILPDGFQFDIRRDFGDARNIDLGSGAAGTIDSGPGGVVTDTSLDFGNSSSHGFTFAGTLPSNSIEFLTRGNDDQLVTFGYEVGDGAVIYSSIPMDFYSRGFNPGLQPEFETYMANLIDYAVRADGDIA